MQIKSYSKETALALAIFFLCLPVMAMESKPTRVVLWEKGETLGGEEFIAAKEDIVDYLATLKRPKGSMQVIRYTCSVKSRLIRPSLHTFGGNSQISGWVEIRMVYELKDCTEVVN